MAMLRDRLWEMLARALGEAVVLNGHPSLRLPKMLNVSFIGWVGAELLASLPDLAASTGSACHDGRLSISPVLAAMGIDPQIAGGAVRMSLGRDTSEDNVDRAARYLVTRAKRR